VYYNVAQLLMEPVGATREYQVAETMPGAKEGWGPLLVEGEVRMLRIPRGLLVTGTLSTDIQEECSRCVEPFREHLDLTVEEEFFSAIDVPTGAEVEVPEEAGPFLISERHILDLQEAVRQAILLARPIQPLCRQGCEGLCPECGTDLNQVHCDCRKLPVDTHRGALEQTHGGNSGDR